MENLDNLAVDSFCEYLKIASVHPDADYADCVRFLRKQATILHLAIKVITLVPKKPIVILTWLGSNPELPAILLNSHMDVVPVSEEHWDHPPFAAEMDSKGNIFARGSQDMKCVGIMYLEAIRRLKNKGITLKRTLHVSFVPDEEIGGKDGMGVFSTSKEFQELNIGFSLDEGLVHDGEEFIAFYAEKIIWQLHVHCGGTPGHGSSLQGNTSGEKFRYIVNKFLDYRNKQQKLNSMVPLAGDDVTSVNLTKVYGGLQENIIPDQLTAVFDIRHSINQNLEEFEEIINKWCKEAGPNVTIEYKQKDSLGGVTAVDKTNPFWVAFKSATDKLNMKIKPITCPGTTDSRYIRLLGIPAIGFTPINKTPMLLHAHNEFINKDSLLKGIKIYYDILTAIANV